VLRLREILKNLRNMSGTWRALVQRPSQSQPCSALSLSDLAETCRDYKPKRSRSSKAAEAGCTSPFHHFIKSFCLRTCNNFCRWNDETYPDIGPIEGPIPEKVDCIIVGAGIAGEGGVLKALDAGFAYVNRVHIR